MSFFFLVVIFIFIWAFWLGGFAQDWGASAVASGDFNGFESFIISNINLWIALGLVASIFFAVSFGGSR